METVIETRAFDRAARDAGMTDAERTSAILTIAADPEAGDLIVGTGGCRKVRIAGRGHGKSGGYRVITFYTCPEGVYLLTVFGKGEKASLTGAEKNALARLTTALKR
ncbi:type II toxin-antitoxin system RelE/ParE family toxin [Brevundimonas aurifodinae]|uniref:Type II toxin-antitoxin system RelE/ParE family toxin n=2 Tax=Brevundimonas TaxID=41275 RepID=A0ABV1NSD8_9CAUL|nr:MAG: addiction module toxin RelE [Brevundimonas subvibrioides]